MSVLEPRDVDDLRAGLSRWLEREVGVIERPPAGFSCETLIVDRELVVRLPPLGAGIFPTYDLALQAGVQDAAGAAGVPVAGPTRYETDPSFLGVPFMAMPFVDGAIPSDFTPADPWLTGLPTDEHRRSVWEGYLDAVVTLHHTPIDGLGLRVGLEHELHAGEMFARWATDGAPPPQLVEVQAWCRTHAPLSEEPTAGLLWGDARLGNVVFDADTGVPKAILDWDMASAGPIEMDLAWHLALEAVQTDLTGMVVPGFGTRDEAIERVAAGVGRDLQDLDWYEVFALARASIIATRITLLQQQAGQRPMFKVGQDPTLAAAVRRIG